MRLNQRYLDEVVLAFDLCPWAEPALRGGRVGRAVCLLETPVAADCLPFIEHFATARTSQVDIGLLLFPRAPFTWAAFDAFAERVRRAHSKPATYLVAAFHPAGPDRIENPHQAVSALRRAPDPMLQFVRAELIDRLKTSQPEASADVGARNFQTMQSGALARLNAALDDIRADREVTYAQLGG